MPDFDPLAVANLIRRTFEAWRTQAVLLLTAITLDALPQIALEFIQGNWTRASGFLSLLTLYLQLLVTIRTTALIGVGPPRYTTDRWTEGRYPGSFFLSLLTVSATLVGLVVLVLPGLVLLVLWSIALPVLVAERLSATNAMRRSWQLIRPKFARLLRIVLLWLLPYLLLIVSSGSLAYLAQIDSPWLWSVVDLCLSILFMTGAVFWAVVYRAVLEANTAA